MNKKQSYLSLFLFASIIILFLFLSPKVSSFLFPFRRNQLWKTFLNNTKSHQVISSKEFWEFRDFYYPGSLVFNVKKLSQKETADAFSTLKISVLPDQYFYPFLYFSSNKIHSLESLVKVSSINNILLPQAIPSNSTIILRDTSTLFYISNNTATLIFIKPVEEMITANGYFNYKRDDKELLKDKFWFVYTVINLE